MGAIMKNGMQKFSRAAIVPVKFMAVMGLFLAFSVIMQLEFMPSFVQTFGGLVNTMMNAMLNNLAVIFCVGIASALATRQKMEAGLISLISFLFFLATNNAWLEMNGLLAEEGAMGLFGTGQGVVLGFQVVDMNVFLGMMIGIIVGVVHNKFSEKEFVDFLSIYGGPRLTFIIMVPIILVLSIGMCYVWPVVNGWISSLSNVMLTAGLFGVFLYAFGNRFLIPTGLHHLLWMPFCFTALGGTAEINGQMYYGAANIFYAEMANAGSIATLDPSLRFATFGFAKVFGSVAVCLAIMHCARKERKDEVRGMMIPPMFVSAAAGITEPIDFTFLFASPLLWLVHSLLTAVSETILWAIGARTYMLYGLIDTIVCNSVFSPNVTKFYLVIIVGLIMGVIWYFTFVFLIKKFDLKTPGREDDNELANVQLNESGTANDSEDTALVIEGLGGEENIEVITNCFTRLRVKVKDAEKISEETLAKVSRQKGIIRDGNNIQIIIGMDVQTFKNDVCESLGILE